MPGQRNVQRPHREGQKLAAVIQKKCEIETIKLGPDMDTVARHLNLLAKPNFTIGGQYQFEIRAIKESLPRSLLFNPVSQESLNSVQRFIEQMNKEGFNIYVTVNPSKSSGANVKDEDIIRIGFLFADADDRGAAEKVKSEAAFKPDAYVCTGTKPYERGHFYWQLEEPLQIDSFCQWKQLMQLIARRHGCDPQICNPSRIMRLGGTISYPSKAKRARGYEIERTGFYDYGTS